jgi:hypothetical protein
VLPQFSIHLYNERWWTHGILFSRFIQGSLSLERGPHSFCCFPTSDPARFWSSQLLEILLLIITLGKAQYLGGFWESRGVHSEYNWMQTRANVHHAQSQTVRAQGSGIGHP